MQRDASLRPDYEWWIGVVSLLEVRNLEVRFAMRWQELVALREVSFSIDKGQRLGIVGESGAGKSVAAFSILNLISKPGYISAGEILFEGTDLTRLSAEGWTAPRS